MKGKNLFFMGLIAVALGLVLILFRDSLASGAVVKAAGILFVAAGVLNVSVFLGSRDKEGRARMGAFGIAFGWIASAAAVVLGLAMLIFSEAFVAITGFMFAVLILFCALFQLFLLFFGARPVHLSMWFFLVPTVLVAAALFIFLRKPDQVGEHVVMIVTGGSFMFFGLASIVEGIAIGQTNRDTLRAARAATAEKQVADSGAPAVRQEPPTPHHDSVRLDSDPGSDTAAK